MRNAAKDAAAAALAARVSADDDKMFYIIASGEFALQACVPSSVPTLETTTDDALSARRRVERTVAVLGAGDHFSEACLESLVAGGPRGVAEKTNRDGRDHEDAVVAAAGDQTPLSPEEAADSADLADMERPAFICSSGKGEVYSIPLVQLLKICGCYAAPVAEAGTSLFTHTQLHVFASNLRLDRGETRGGFSLVVNDKRDELRRVIAAAVGVNRRPPWAEVTAVPPVSNPALGIVGYGGGVGG